MIKSNSLLVWKIQYLYEWISKVPKGKKKKEKKEKNKEWDYERDKDFL